MGDSTKYNPLVAWQTIANNVFILTEATVDFPATFRITVDAIDPNEKGVGEKSTGFVFTDYFGVPFNVIGTGVSTIDVSDDFRTGICPTEGEVGIVHKSAYKGQSLFLPAESFRHLHPLAGPNNNKYAMAILWGNDPNPKRIAFASTDNPKIEGYQGAQPDGSKLAEDYGENPKCRLMEIIDGIVRQRTELPYFTYTGLLIDSIKFAGEDGIGDTINCYIEISR